MSDNFHKFLFLGVMLAITVLANRNPGLNDAAVQGANGLAPIAVEKSTSAVAVGLPPHVSTGNLYAAANVIGKDALGDTLSSDLPAASPSNTPAAQVNEFGMADTSLFLQSGAGTVHSVFRRVGDEPLPETGAKIALVADLGSGDVFYARNAAMRWPTASIAKLMAAEIIAKGGFLNQSTTITEAEFAIDGSLEDLKVGERYSVADLMSAMLIESSNESAMALADVYGYDAFIKTMNEEVKNLGLNNTYFSDPVGLSAANQSTASDLLVLTQHIYAQYQEIFKITKKISAYLTELNSGSRLAVKNINNFAGQADFLGGKTGYTNDASGNLLSIFSYQKQPIFIIVMGTEDRFGDTQKLLEWFKRNYR